MYELRQQAEVPQRLEDAWISYKDIIWFVLYDGFEWIAYGGIHKANSLGAGYIGPSYVRPEYRGHGLQRELIKARERYAREHGYKYLTSWTDIDNPHSMNNLLACGFKIVPGPKDAYYFEKELTDDNGL